MQAELIAHTQPNQALDARRVAGQGDLATLWQGKGTFAENMMEYAGRVCYRSTARMGTAPDFIADRIREGHEDIIEHVVVTVRLQVEPGDAPADSPAGWRGINRHGEVSDLGNGAWLVSGNTRVWLDLFRGGIGLAALPAVRAVAPAVFSVLPGGETGEDGETRGSVRRTPERPPDGGWAPDGGWERLRPREDGPMRVTLLGWTQPALADPALRMAHGAATFFFEGISRTCTHQLVRHRLASFSQESQRYVDLNKGDWRAIVPPAVAANPAALAEMEEFWRLAEEKYARLRSLGIRKEDARFLLPNAAETRIITTMNYAAWTHFLWLRAVDKAAQWEIRLMGQRALELLHEIAPETFAEPWRVYQEQFTS